MIVRWLHTRGVERALNKAPCLLYPYIVNKAFACEEYLKLIIKENNFNVNFSKHDLVKLYNDSNIASEFEAYYVDEYKREYEEKEDVLTQLEYNLTTISQAFVKWRYIYEKSNEEIQIGFLQVFCDYLDEYTRQLLIDKYNVDMNELYI